MHERDSVPRRGRTEGAWSDCPMTQAPEQPLVDLPVDPGPAVGRPVDRVAGAGQTSGAAVFSAEYPSPALAHAAMVHAGIPRGRITGVDTAAAEAVEGVLAV